MSKFDTCIYAEYFGDYGMDICNHPSRGEDHMIDAKIDCRKCKLHMTEKGALKKCPFCGKEPKILQYEGQWHISCHRCGVEMSDDSVDKVTKRWNTRV